MPSAWPMRALTVVSLGIGLSATVVTGTTVAKVVTVVSGELASCVARSVPPVRRWLLIAEALKPFGGPTVEMEEEATEGATESEGTALDKRGAVRAGSPEEGERLRFKPAEGAASALTKEAASRRKVERRGDGVGDRFGKERSCCGQEAEGWKERGGKDKGGKIGGRLDGG